MSTAPDELPEEFIDPLQDALIQFTGCIGESLDGVCSYGLTIGETYVPFNPDEDDECEDEDQSCNQAWVRVVSVVVAHAQQGGDGECGGVFRLELEVGVMRCIELEEGGEAPSASEVLVSAAQSMTDMRAIHCAAMGCEVWDSIDSGEWLPIGPMGGQYGGTWSFTVETI